MISLAEQISTLKAITAQISRDFRNLQKQHEKDKKTEVASKKRRRGKKPTGFASPTEVSMELKQFLSLEKEAKIARTEVTKRIIAYVKDHNLNNGTKIQLDDNLKRIVRMGEKDELTFFNLQTYINHNFVKNTSIPDINR